MERGYVHESIVRERVHLDHRRSRTNYDLAFCQTRMDNQGRFCCLPSAQHYMRARYGKSCVSSVKLASVRM